MKVLQHQWTVPEKHEQYTYKYYLNPIETSNGSISLQMQAMSGQITHRVCCCKVTTLLWFHPEQIVLFYLKTFSPRAMNVKTARMSYLFLDIESVSVQGVYSSPEA